MRLIVVAVACFGWALVFLGLAGPSVAWALFDLSYWDWTLGMMGCGATLILLCWPFAIMLDLT